MDVRMDRSQAALRSRSRALLSELGRMRTRDKSPDVTSTAGSGRGVGHGLTLEDLRSHRSTPDPPPTPAPPNRPARAEVPAAAAARASKGTGSVGDTLAPRGGLGKGDEARAREKEKEEQRSAPTATQGVSERAGGLPHSQAGGRHRPLGRDDATLLGYDWIAGMLDNGSPLDEKDDAFFDELNAFRKVNYHECHAPASLFDEIYGKQQDGESERSKPEGGPEGEPEPPVQPAYRINDRLFPELIEDPNLAEGIGPANGKFVRVSVPGKFIKPQQRPAHHRRDSFDPSNSLALSKHCVLGWETAKPAMLPPQGAVDLRSSTNKRPVHPLFSK